MIFSNLQLTSLLKMGLDMANADGRFTEEETMAMIVELTRLGVDPDDAQDLLHTANEMDASVAISALSNMTQDQKIHAEGYLAMIMIADRDIDNSEVVLWKLICTLCNFPKMSIKQAVEAWGKGL